VSLLEVDQLTIRFPTRAGVVQALDRVSLSVEAGELLAIVGESGSGKSVLSYAISGVLDASAEVAGGRLLWKGQPLPFMRESRKGGARISQIFQSPRASLNPIRSVGQVLGDVMRCASSDARVAAGLDGVRIAEDKRRNYPFELSGGQCQRVGIALALANGPELLLADEPTTGLDVTTEAAIMKLLTQLARDKQVATIFVTHNLALAATHCDRIAVMHAGQVVETGSIADVLRSPRHPYTAQLISATPQHCANASELRTIPGSIPDLAGELPPCRFAARCERHAAACDQPALSLVDAGQGRRVACRFPLAA
jgi:peptide/nickel transport system ATP-binding protein